jgi:hypothetical protein
MRCLSSAHVGFPSLYVSQQDFSENLLKPPLERKALQGCFEEREDYFECLHGTKQFMRYEAVMKEMHRQEEEKKNGDGGGH